MEKRRGGLNVMAVSKIHTLFLSLLVWMYSKNTKNAGGKYMITTEMKLDGIKNTGGEEEFGNIWKYRKNHVTGGAILSSKSTGKHNLDKGLGL